MNKSATYDIIKRDFCNLFSFKSHGDTLEIITPLTTLTDKFVSVFLTQRGSKLIVTDGGYILKEIYEHSLLHLDSDIVNVTIDRYKDFYKVKEKEASGDKFYYQSTDRIELLSSVVFQLAHFILGVVNSYSLDYREKKEIDEKDRFKSETNSFLQEHYQDSFEKNFKPVKGLRYSGVIKIDNKLNLLEYVTGHKRRYIEQDIRKAIINFQLIQNNPLREMVSSKIVIFNDESAGYQAGVPPILHDYLQEYASDILTRTQRNKVFEIVSLN